MKKAQHSREYLEEMLKLAKTNLPGWAYAMVHDHAKAVAGGRVTQQRRREAKEAETVVAKQEPRATKYESFGGLADRVRGEYPLQVDAIRGHANAEMFHVQLRREGDEIKPKWPGAEAEIDSVLINALLGLPADAFVVDGVLVVPEDGDSVLIVHDLPVVDEENLETETLATRRRKLEVLLHPGLSGTQDPPPQPEGRLQLSQVRRVEDDAGLERATRWVFDNGKAMLLARKLAGNYSEPVAMLHHAPDDIAKALVNPTGPERAAVAFVGAWSTELDVARREPMVADAGETLRDVYLSRLGVGRSDVALVNVVPVPCEKRAEDLNRWRGWVVDQIAKLRPKTVVALGREARRALGDLADETLPHPLMVRKAGDSGEVGRKLKRLKALIKQRSEEGSETRGEAAQRAWEENWIDWLPKSGKGKFVYQHHWRGLTEDQAKLPEAELYGTRHSLHGDLRFDAPGGLFGWAVMLGSEADNAKLEHQDKLMAGRQDLRLAPKLQHAPEWLNHKGPIAPGQAGATNSTWSKVFIEDSGNYAIGVAQRNSVEIFLDGKVLNGRYILTYAPVDRGRRIWLINKPEDQTPRAETENLSDLTAELKRKKRKSLYWAKPGARPRIIDLTGAVQAQIAKSDPTKRIVYGIVLDPYGKQGPEPDAHDDWVPPASVEAAAHDFLQSSRLIRLQHSKSAVAEVVESSVEQYPTREDYLAAMTGEPHKVTRRKFGSDVIHSGSWMLGVKLGPKEWADYEAGKINAFSPGGYGYRSPIDRSDMPKVTFVDLVEAQQ